MKIMFVTPYFYPKVGGLENYAYNIAKRLAKKDEVIVITTNHKLKKYKTEIIEGIKVYRLPILFKISNTPINPFWYFSLKKIITLERPDLVNAHLPVPFISDLACFLAHKKRTPYIVTYHAGSMVKEKNLFINIGINIYELILLNRLLFFSKKIICSSKFVRDNFLKKYKEKSVVINPGVDFSLFKPLKVKKKKDSVIYIGKLDTSAKWKGVDILLNAVRESNACGKDITVNCVGEGDLVEVYKKMYPERNFNFFGRKTGLDLVEEINKNQILVLPSISPAESFGMVLAEANACGIPVIGSNVGGVNTVIKEGYNGLLVPSKDTSALSKAINKLLENKFLAKKLGRNGIKRAKRLWDWNDITKKTFEVFVG